MTVCNCMFGHGWRWFPCGLHRRLGADEKLGAYERLIGEADDQIAELRQALENLAGDAYLYVTGDINSTQLMATQGEALRTLGDEPA